MDLKNCESCGMPMARPGDFGGRDVKNRYCKYCTYANGTLKPRHEVREGMVAFYMKAKRMERKSAEEYVDERMAGMPAWR
jgi:hypothetical protein